MGGDTFSFGWKESDKFSTSTEKCILSINTNAPTEVSVATLSDYIKYCKSLTGLSPKEFIKIWKDDIELLEETQKDTVKNYKYGQGRFLYNLNNLLLNGESFVYEDIKYKII